MKSIKHTLFLMNPSTAAADLLAKERGIRWYKSITHDEWPSRVTPLARFSWDQIKNGGVRLSRCFRYQGLQGWYLSHRQQNVKTVQINITRGTTDPGIESVTWVINCNLFVQRHSRLYTAWVQLTQHLLTVRAKAAVFSHWSRSKGNGKGEAWP